MLKNQKYTSSISASSMLIILFADAFLRLLNSFNDNLTIKHIAKASIASFYSFDILFVASIQNVDYLNFLLSQKSNINAR